MCYGALAGYAFWLYAYGPALALLRAELRFSYTLLGVYSALWSAGAALAGVSFAPAARRRSRAAMLWSSAVGTTAGAGLFTLAHMVALTLLGGVLLGFAGTTLLTCTQAILSDRHGERRELALSEANVGAAGCAVLAPLLLGLCQATPLGWRAALGLPALLLAGLYLRYRRQPLPTPPAPRATGRQARLSLSCWSLASLVAVGIAVEFCLVYFGAEVLAATGMRTAQAAAAMSGFYLGILSGRVGGAYLTRRAGRTVPLLCGSLAVTAAGFVVFWLSGTPALAIGGLGLCGLGVANLYPLSLALTLGAAPGNGDTANARTQLLGGLLVTAAPYLLGSLADQFGLHAAFTIEPVLIGLAALLLLAGLWLGPARTRACLPGCRPGRRAVMVHAETAAGLLALMTRAAGVLTSAGVPFAVAGGAAAYARGGLPPEHDIDFVIRPEDVPAATTALAGAGLRIVRPPEDWLVKAFDGDDMLDLIFCLAGEPVTSGLLDRAVLLDVGAARLPVLAGTDLVVSWLRAFSEQHADFARVLAMVRPIRGHADWPAVRAATRGYAFAAAFLLLLERLHVIEPEEVPARG